MLKPRILIYWLTIFLFALGAISAAAQSTRPAGGYATWPNGPSDSANYFPIGVWLQDPANARQYKNIGINLYIGLYKGPTAAQLSTLEQVGMPVICEQNDFALHSLDRKIIVGWTQQDEPDNAQSLPGGKGYGPPVTPEAVQASYDKMRASDPSRPIYLNLGVGVAWDEWIGRGVRTNHPEDYQQYEKAGDIVSFDIYPAASGDKQVAGKLWLVPFGVDRLCNWSQNQKFVWNCIETTRVSNAAAKVTPVQVKSEVWMSIIHGSHGIVYFAHQFKPKFIEAGLLADKAMAAAIGTLNAQIAALAPVLNSPTIKDGAAVSSSAPDVSIDFLVKHYDGATYLFAAAMRDGQTQAAFTLPGRKGSQPVMAIGEERVISSTDGRWDDAFGGYDVHLYRILD